MQLPPFCLMLSCLQVSPDQSQFFRGKLREADPGLWLRLGDHSLRGELHRGDTASGACCTVGTTYPSDSGVYWCESGDGRRSNNSINITITDRPVLLKCPVLPLSEGSDATLHCQAASFSSDHTFDFQRDGFFVASSRTGEMTIRKVSKSDEGLYSCSIPKVGESVGSWLTVQGSSSAPPAASCQVSVPRLMCHLVVGTPFLLSTILLGLIYRDRNRAARTAAQRRGSKDVVMEI
ncbi:High affinity immunoglobulin gamma Fc receptor I [Dissostichus eleginoides]|nr:High affinity immunoglobulin gamma Fc receptor I [Dissostichus eleginoides]